MNKTIPDYLSKSSTTREKRELKIALLTPFPPKEDGVAEYSSYLVESLQKEEVHTYIIAQVAKKKQKSIVKKSFKNNVEILEIWDPKSIVNQIKVFRKILQINPDVIHVQYGPYSGYGGILGEPLLFLFLLLRMSNFRCIVTLHSIWLPKEAELRAYERLNNHFLSKIAASYYCYFMKAFLSACNFILVCVNFSGSPVVKQITDVFGLPPCKIQQIVHGSVGIINSQQKSEAKENLKITEKLVLCFGFIRPDKGYEYAIKALSLLRKKNLQIKLIIAGIPSTAEGWNYLSFLKDKASELHVNDDIIFDVRYVPEKDLYNYFLSSDILLLPYSRRVGPSGPLAIAASFGLPVIMTSDKKFAASNNIPFVEQVPPCNSDVLASTIEKMICDEKVMLRMVNSATDFSKEYSFDEIAKQHLSIYQNILDK